MLPDLCNANFLAAFPIFPSRTFAPWCRDHLLQIYHPSPTQQIEIELAHLVIWWNYLKYFV